MTDETPELPPSSEESPTPEKPAVKKVSRKKPAHTRPAGETEEVSGESVSDGTEHKPEAEETPAAEARAAKAGPEPVVEVQNGIETREIASENARRVSSKRVGPATEGSSPSPSGAAGQAVPAADSEEESGPVIGEPDGGEESVGGGKRRRRRRRRGGAEDAESGEAPVRQKSALDPKRVAAKAWKIYKAEVAEEGLALINDNDARELSRRSFRLAEIFLEEASKRP